MTDDLIHTPIGTLSDQLKAHGIRLDNIEIVRGQKLLFLQMTKDGYSCGFGLPSNMTLSTAITECVNNMAKHGAS